MRFESESIFRKRVTNSLLRGSSQNRLAKKELFMPFWPIFGNFWCPVVTLVTFSSNLSNFEKNTKNL